MSGPAPAPTVYTIGHSNHPLDQFLNLLKGAAITAVADVRSAPYSRRNPQFNREPLIETMRQHDISYVYLGAELGGRPQDSGLWRGARPDYERIATSPHFCEGLGRIEKGMANHNIAVMCAEREPLDCHRCLLVARAMKERGITVRHILEGGVIENHDATEARIMAWAKMPSADMFDDPETRLSDAYRKRAGWIWNERP